MTGAFATGLIVDLILAAMLAEVIVVAAYHRITGRGVAPGDLIYTVLAGTCLLLALRGALVGARWVWIALYLSAAFLMHLADLRRRWKR